MDFGKNKGFCNPQIKAMNCGLRKGKDVKTVMADTEHRGALQRGRGSSGISGQKRENHINYEIQRIISEKT